MKIKNIEQNIEEGKGKINTFSSHLPEDIDLGRRFFLGKIGVILLASSIPDIVFSKKNNETEKNTLEKIMPKIINILRLLYGNNTPTSLKEASNRVITTLNDIVNALNSEGLNIKSKNLQLNLMHFFKKYGYIFYISPIQLNTKAFIVNAPLYKIGNKKKGNLSELKFDKFPIINKEITFIEINEIIIEDVRESSPHIKEKIIFDGMTISSNIDENLTNIKPEVLLFTDRVSKIAKEKGLIYEDYEKVVKMNELSQIYFLEIIPNELLGIQLSDLGIDTRGENWTFYYVQEAFSDFSSLKEGKAFKNEIIRIITTKNFSYDFSRKIAIASFQLGLINMGSIFKINENNIEGILDNMNKEMLKKIKETVLGSYEANIILIINNLFAYINKNS